MMKSLLPLLKEAIIGNCGGFENANDSEIQSKWDSLDEETQKTFKQKIETKTKKEKPKDAIIPRPQPDV